jgi:sarcosine oxidase subunit delta
VRIVCPYCGERGNEEFSYLGDASPVRPDPAGADAAQKFAEYVYLRDNPRGPLRELWYHTAGCHSWLVVTRDTISHEITLVQFARDVETVRAPTTEVRG